jgi:MFS family permease
VGESSNQKAAASAGFVLLTLASAQFLMTVDMSVMNVSIATVAEDLDTTVTGIQTAITLYTLVMATLMITGGKIGTIIGRRRAFSLGCIIYGVGSLTTGLAPSLTVLIIGWSFLEGIGAALIMPAVVALVAGNFPPKDRPRAYGLIAAAAAVAVAAGPIIGGAATTYASWRLVFFAEVAIALTLLVMSGLGSRVAPRVDDRVAFGMIVGWLVLFFATRHWKRMAEGSGRLFLRNSTVEGSDLEGISLGNCSLEAINSTIAQNGMARINEVEPRSGLRAEGGRGQKIVL